MIHKFFRKLPKRNGKSRDSSNINEVIRSVLNFLFFFYKNISQAQKSTKPLTEKSYLFAYLGFVLLLGCVFMLLMLLVLLVH